MLVYDRGKMDFLLYVQFSIKDQKIDIIMYYRDHFEEIELTKANRDLMNEVVNILMHYLWKGL
jgi:sulfur relay (sulfurtransferase) DsrC/TusE family protein